MTLGNSTRLHRWSRADFRQPSQHLAPALLGQLLVRILDDGTRLVGRIVETEAYLGVKDRAAHSYGGRRTERTEAMYRGAGTAYVYFTYGMHHCFNIVSGEIDEPVAVLIRALEPLEGIDAMLARRRSFPKAPRLIRPIDLASGPARLCQAFDIDRRLNMLDLTASDRLYVAEVDPPARARIAVTARIGVESAGEWASRPLRFFIDGNPHVSR